MSRDLVTGWDWAMGEDTAAGRLLGRVVWEAFHFLPDILYKLTSSPLNGATGTEEG